MKSSQVALELYTVRDQTKHDFAGTLRRVAQLGYTAVEFAGYGGLTAQEMTALLAETKLRVAGTHIGLQALEQDLEREIAYCLDIGCSFLVLPWLAAEWRNVEALRRLAPRLNEIGQRCYEHGITFAYHNHDFDFAQHDGRYLLDDLLRATNPSLVLLELDAYWAAYANVDPVTYLQQHIGRIPLVHLKDMTPERTFTEVGNGIMDYKAICAAAQESGVQWYIVENDSPLIPSLESAKRSLDYLSSLVE